MSLLSKFKAIAKYYGFKGKIYIYPKRWLNGRYHILSRHIEMEIPKGNFKLSKAHIKANERFNKLLLKPLEPKYFVLQIFLHELGHAMTFHELFPDLESAWSELEIPHSHRISELKANQFAYEALKNREVMRIWNRK